MGQHNWHASLSYVTGAHNMKFGYQGTFYADDEQYFTNDEKVAYRFNNGVPEPDHADAPFEPAQAAHALQRALRAGAVDARADDAAGRAALRPRVELLPGTGRRTDAVPADADRRFPRPTA